MRKKLLLILIFAFILFIGIIFKIFFFGNTMLLWDMNNDKTIYVHIGNIVIVSPSSPINAIYLSKNNILRPVSGVTGVSAAAPPTPYVFSLTGKGKPTFRVVTAGSVEIDAPIQCGPPGSMCAISMRKYHFKVIATE